MIKNRRYHNMKKRNITKFSLIFGITLFLVVLFLLTQMIGKNGFHIDEIYSYGLANSNYHPFPWEFDTWLSGDYYQNYLTVAENEAFNYGSVYYNQTQDVHPPLYYFILHTISSLFPGMFSKWIGLSINLVIHISVFYVLYKLLDNIIENKWISLFGSVFWILSKGAIDSLLFIRMYPLLTLIQVFLIYISLRFYKKKNKRDLFYLFFIIILGALTHYYFYIYAFLLTLIVCIILLFERNMKQMFMFGSTALAGVVSAIIIFPSVITHVLESNRGQEVLDGFENNITAGENTFFEFVRVDVLRDIPSYMVIILGVVLFATVLYKLMRNKSSFKHNKILLNKNIKKIIIIILPVLLYIFTVQQVSYYKTSRYIFSIYPIIVLGLFITLYFLLRLLVNKKEYVNIIIGLFTLIFVFIGIKNQNSDYKFNYIEYMNEYIEDIEEQEILVLMDEYWKVSNYVIDLSYFKQIYPVEIGNNPVENLPTDNSFNNLEDLYVLYSKNDNIDTTKEIGSLLLSEYNFETIDKISENSSMILYELK